MINFFTVCYETIMSTDINAKCRATQNLYNELNTAPEQIDFTTQAFITSIKNPGLPPQLELVSPLKVPRRRLGNPLGHAGLIHALAHIEFNAINLALDACYRFQNMPREYYQNWLQVAYEEVYHFELLNEHLRTLGFSYGDFVAHNGLWDMAIRTEYDVLVRMALVPRVLEARGIDAVPEMQGKLFAAQDLRAVEILDIIHHDEIKHVAFGDYWFKYLCQQRKLDTETTFFTLIEELNAPKIRGAFNRTDRKLAGFNDSELDRLYNL